MPEPDRLHPDDIEAIALRVVALLKDEAARPSATKEFPTASEIAERYGLSTDWVYKYATELGAVPLGNTKRPRLRFPALTVERFMTEHAEMRIVTSACRRPPSVSTAGRSTRS